MNADNTSGLRGALDFVNRQPCRCMSIAQLGERDYCDRCQSVKNLRALIARTEAEADGVVEPNGPEFTDWARAALSWVLYHHQGGSSPVGQPIRFALGMGANERLPDWRIADGKRWAAQTGSTTADFHTHPQDASGDAVTEADIVALVAGPYKYHHKMDEQAEREAKAFDRCRELTIQKVQTFFAMRAAMQAKEAK